MNTPAHAVLNLVILGRKQTRSLQLVVLLGALLPDLPMLLFYLVTKVFMGIRESRIWDVHYHQAGWQNFFALFNSLPLIGLGLLISCLIPSTAGRLFFMSMLLHVLFDLPLHNYDAHRHLYPFSDWRFHSPVSYWDPNHYGTIVTTMEISMVMLAMLFLWRRDSSVFVKSILLLISGAYLAYFGYVRLMWA